MGVEVTLVIIIVGLTSGMVQETAKRIEGVGADIMLQPPSASVFLAFSGAPMPIRIGDRLRELKYVQAVAPVLLQFNSTGGIDIVYGIDPETFRAVSGGFVFLARARYGRPGRPAGGRFGGALEAHHRRQHLPAAGSRFPRRRHRRARQGRAGLRAAGDACRTFPARATKLRFFF